MLLYLLLPVCIFADQSGYGLKSQVINPGSFYYPVKRLIEKAQYIFIFSNEAKLEFGNGILRNRLSELDYVIERKRLDEVQRASERMAAQAGLVTDLAVRMKKQELSNTVLKEFESQIGDANKLRDRYEANSSYWMLVQHVINTLSELSERLKPTVAQIDKR